MRPGDVAGATTETPDSGGISPCAGYQSPHGADAQQAAAEVGVPGVPAAGGEDLTERAWLFPTPDAAMAEAQTSEDTARACPPQTTVHPNGHIITLTAVTRPSTVGAWSGTRVTKTTTAPSGKQVDYVYTLAKTGSYLVVEFDVSFFNVADSGQYQASADAGVGALLNRLPN